MPTYVLQPHPATPAAAARAFSLEATLIVDATGWHLRYTLRGDWARLRLPTPRATPGRAEGLWRHTCFELFRGTTATPAYEEFNFSPSGAWASYRFLRERVPAPAGHGAIPGACRSQGPTPQELVLHARLPAPAASANVLIGLSAVLEADDGSLSYWALRHSRPQPDFHARAGWVQPAALSLSTKELNP